MHRPTAPPATAPSGTADRAGTPGLPEALRTASGAHVTDPRGWRERRRPELLELFRANVHGRNPVDRPADQRFAAQAESAAMGGAARRKQAEIRFSGPGGSGRIRILAFIPEVARPAPACLLICHRAAENLDPDRRRRTPFWPAEELVARGYAAIAFDPDDCAPDCADRFPAGVHRIFDPPGRPRGADAWATIAGWAWGASRVMDWVAAEPLLDPGRVAVVGHSRGGKAALWAGAQDERFAMVVSNGSGCTGAALARGTTGETVEQITRSFPHWFCGAYGTYGGRVEQLPVDQHLLLALIAPRLLYVASASEDAHADPAGELRACLAASPVFALLGGTGLGLAGLPLPGTAAHDGGIGYHLRAGGHDLTLVDWMRILDFADRRWGSAR